VAFREVGVHEMREVLRLWLWANCSAPLRGWRGWTVRRSGGMWRRPANAAWTGPAASVSSAMTC